jgi:hypothetical protein
MCASIDAEAGNTPFLKKRMLHLGITHGLDVSHGIGSYKTRKLSHTKANKLQSKPLPI